MEDKFIDIRNLIKSKNPKLAKWLPGFIINYLRKILHEDEVNEFIYKNKDVRDIEFCSNVVKYLNMDVEIQNKERIPQEGKVVIAMNHPLGGMDAMTLVHCLKGHREDLKFIVNDILLNIKSLQGIFVGVDKHGKNGLSTKKQLENLFQLDEAICVFPAGLVSREIDGEIMDLEWKKTFISLSKPEQRTIIPVYIDGKLSKSFYRIARIRKKIGIKVNIEMLYLSDELFKLRNKQIRIIVGEPIPYNSLPNDLSPRKQAEYIKSKVYALK
jgi:putative hemolysin